MKSTYVGTRSANVGDIRCLFAPPSDSTNKQYRKRGCFRILTFYVTIWIYFMDSDLLPSFYYIKRLFLL